MDPVLRASIISLITGLILLALVLGLWIWHWPH
jgi:hypothetical protein